MQFTLLHNLFMVILTLVTIRKGLNSAHDLNGNATQNDSRGNGNCNFVQSPNGPMVTHALCKTVHHVPKCISYYGPIGGMVITGRAHCLSFWLHIYIYYAHLTSVGFEHSMCHESLLTSFIYIYIPQSELRNVKKQEEKKILSFVSTFNSNNPKALPIIKQTLENLKTSDRMRNALEKVKFINCKRQAPNIGRIMQEFFFTQ